jgi:hypothetical protein
LTRFEKEPADHLGPGSSLPVGLLYALPRLVDELMRKLQRVSSN